MNLCDIVLCVYFEDEVIIEEGECVTGLRPIGRVLSVGTLDFGRRNILFVDVEVAEWSNAFALRAGGVALIRGL